MVSEKQPNSLTAILARLKQEGGSATPRAADNPSLDALHAHLGKLTRLVSSSPSQRMLAPASAKGRLESVLAKLQSIIDQADS